MDRRKKYRKITKSPEMNKNVLLLKSISDSLPLLSFDVKIDKNHIVFIISEFKTYIYIDGFNSINNPFGSNQPINNNNMYKRINTLRNNIIKNSDQFYIFISNIILFVLFTFDKSLDFIKIDYSIDPDEVKQVLEEYAIPWLGNFFDDVIVDIENSSKLFPLFTKYYLSNVSPKPLLIYAKDNYMYLPRIIRNNIENYNVKEILFSQKDAADVAVIITVVKDVYSGYYNTISLFTCDHFAKIIETYSEEFEPVKINSYCNFNNFYKYLYTQIQF